LNNIEIPRKGLIARPDLSLSQSSQRTQSYEQLQKEDLIVNGSLKSSMGRLFGGENKLAYFTLQTGSTLTPMQFHRDFPLSGAFKQSKVFL
jgi:hypothetical protein